MHKWMTFGLEVTQVVRNKCRKFRKFFQFLRNADGDAVDYNIFLPSIIQTKCAFENAKIKVNSGSQNFECNDRLCPLGYFFRHSREKKNIASSICQNENTMLLANLLLLSIVHLAATHSNHLVNIKTLFLIKI